MGFTFIFLKIFGIGLFYASPIVLFLVALIIILGLIVGKREGWSVSDSLYYAFITATTVGYGDYRPSKQSAKMLAIGIALVGLLMTGIVVAIGLESASIAFKEIHPVPLIETLKK